MSDFFDSDMVRESLFELDQIQEKIFEDVFMIPFLNKDQKLKHLELMKTFLEKQKIFIFRLSLSEDSEAIEMKEKIMESAKMFGLVEGEDISVFFNNMEKAIQNLEKSLDNEKD